MSLDNFKLIMSYLDVIEIELNKIADAVGHPRFDEWPNVINGEFTGP